MNWAETQSFFPLPSLPLGFSLFLLPTINYCYLDSTATYSDNWLFNRIAENDQAAFRQLFDRYRYEIFGVAMKLTKSPLQSEEITQEVFISLWVSRAKLAAVERPDSYIFRVLYNKVSNYLRTESNRERIVRDAARFSATAVNTTQEMVEVHESSRLIEAALEQLPQQQRLVYELSRKQGLSIDQIAGQLNISPHTVKSHLAKALSFIKTYLKDLAMITGLIAQWWGNTRS